MIFIVQPNRYRLALSDILQPESLFVNPNYTVSLRQISMIGSALPTGGLSHGTFLKLWAKTHRNNRLTQAFDQNSIYFIHIKISLMRGTDKYGIEP